MGDKTTVISWRNVFPLYRPITRRQGKTVLLYYIISVLFYNLYIHIVPLQYYLYPRVQIENESQLKYNPKRAVWNYKLYWV